MVLSNTHHTPAPCDCQSCNWSGWRKTSILPSPERTPVRSSPASTPDAKDRSPKAFPNRLRICRLMYKPLPNGSCKSDLRQHRNRRLALVKKRAIRLVQAFAARRAIPHYFQKRTKHTLLLKKSASPDNNRVTTDNAPSPVDGSTVDGVIEEVSANCTDSLAVERDIIQVKEEEESSANPKQHIVSLSAECKTLAVANRKLSPIDRADTLSTIKEYYSIQRSIRLLLAMLQERMEEVETMQKKSIMDAPEEERAETESLPLDSGVESNGTLTEDDPTVCDESSTKLEATETPDSSAGDIDPNKENNVPADDSTLETMAPASVALNRANSTPSKDEAKEDARPYSFLETSKSDILDPAYTCDIELEPLEQRKNRSIVDSLLNKFNLSPPEKASVPCSFSDNSQDGLDGRRSLRDRTKIAARPRYIEIPEEPRKMRVSKVFGKLHKTLNIDLDCTNSNSSTEFYGFDEGEVVKLDKPSLPGLLPTPIVKKSQPFAPFLAYGTSMDADTVETGAETRSDLFREEGLISFGSLPPRLECPQRPNDMVRPRTVAQKRILVQRENDVRYLMIDNESKIFQFLKKRSKNIDAALDFCRMKELQDQQIPFTRDTWRALAWLRTEKGRYYFQTMNIDNRTIKLSGCGGNHRYKTLSRHALYSSPVIASRGHRYHYVSNCHCPPFPEGIRLNITPNADGLTLDNRSIAERRMDGDNSRYLYHSSSDVTGHHSKRSYPGTKPGPLSSKCMQPTPDDDPTLGRLEVFKMPPVELEVFPKLNRPLDGFVQPYLKMILPHDGITENWARFAVSTLKADGDVKGSSSDLDEKKERSFVFELPYLNNQRRMLIRRRFLACPGLPVHCDVKQFEKLMEEKLTFRAAIDKALTDGKQDEIDPDELVCADVLSEITDSVAIALAEDIFVKDDPEVDYVKREGKARPSREQLTMPLKIETPVPEAGGGDVKAASPTPAARSDAGPGGDVTPNAAAAASECSKTVDPVKSKLLREMKRLNATIIEGPSEPVIDSSETSRQQHQQSQKRCDPQYCSLGCICEMRHSSQPSAMAMIQRKQHCKKIDCIFGCQCGYDEKRVSQAQELKMDLAQMTDNETTPLSSADVKYLREKATARLAKEEREFTHTIILTKNTTVLVHNKECESRRQKKKPKKYDDYYNDVTMSTLLNGGSPKDVSDYISKPPPNAKPLSPADRMRHAHVLLTRLPQLGDIEPLCMVHDLYRCFCDGKATQGKPFSFTEENCVSPGKTYARASENAALVVMSVGGSPASAGRMMKVSQYEEPSYDTTSIANVRKRLYSFERAHNEPYDESKGTSSSSSGNSSGSDGKSFKEDQVGTAALRRRRDSSEESYKPPNERRVAKKKLHSSFDDKSATSATAAAVRARRASVVPARRTSVGVAALRKGASLAMRRASVAHSSSKEANAFKSPVKSETPSADDAQYTVVKQKKASGESGINNIIIKRIPSQTPSFEPMVKKPSGESLKPGAKKPARFVRATMAAEMAVPVKYMSVRTLKQLMLAEYRNSPDVMDTPDLPPGNSEPPKPAFVNVLLLDSEENIDNEPQLNILSDGTKKLVVNGNRRSFIESSAFREGRPPARTMPFPSRTTYVVQILSANSVREVETMVFKTPPAKENPNEAKPAAVSPRAAIVEQSPTRDVPVETPPQQQQQQQQPDIPNPFAQTDRQLGTLMRHINELLRRQTLCINPSKKGIMHICRWSQLLNAFALGEIDILDLTLTNGLELTVIATAPFKHPLVPNVKHQISARRLTIDKMIAAERPSLLMKMVVCQVENMKTNELALVLYGNEHFWHFCGFLKVNEKSFKNDSNIPKVPSKYANAKIKAKLNDYHSKTVTAKSSTAMTQPNHPARHATVHKQPLTTFISSSSSSSTMVSEPGPSPKMLSTQSNVEIMPKAIQPVHFPLGLLPGIVDSSDGRSNCRWMRLKIENDFSHMYLPSWHCCVTYSRIKKAIYDANRLAQPIRIDNPTPPGPLSKHQRPYMYALPKEGHALFLGPYPLTETKIDVILCQSVRGSLYEREVYEKQHGIQMPANTKRTVGWWVDAILSRVASVKDNRVRIMGAQTEVAKASTSIGAATNNNTTQRSLLKRNNVPSATVVSTDRQVATTANDPNDTDDDDVVLVESDEDNERLLAEEQNKSTANEEPPTTRRELSVEKIGMDLFRLVEGTMKQNQQEKREIEKVLNQERFTHSVADEHHSRKRQSSPLPPKVNHAPAAKVIRLSDVGRIEKVSVLPHQQQQQQQQQKPLPSGIKVPPSSTIVRNSFTRISLPGPQSVKVVGSNAVVTKSINGTSTLTIAPLKPTEANVPVKLAQNVPLRAPGPSTVVKPTAARPMSTTTKAVFTSGSLELGGVAGVVTPRARLNSVAVERAVVPVRPAPVMHESDNDDDDVVWLDDDDDDTTNNTVPSSAAPAGGSVVERATPAAATAGTSTTSNGVVAYGHKTILSQEQIAMIARKVDLTKTGQQDGYSFNPASGLLKMKRSLLNSIKNDVMLEEGSTLPTIEKSSTTVSSASAGGKVGGVVINSVKVIPSASTISMNGKIGIAGSSSTKSTVPATVTSLNGKAGVVANTTNNTSQSTTVSVSSVSKVNASSPPSSSTITMPRTKVVPRVTVTPATARYGDVPGRQSSDGAGNTAGSPGSVGAASVMEHLKYLSEAQEEQLLLEQPHTRGVLESKISGLGLVEVVRFEREVIIHMKELTVKKQLVSVKNLEAAVTLLNQFIQRNTYAFRPYNLAIQWKFKERSLPLRQEERITSVINQHCVVTVYGIINLAKPEQVQPLETTLPDLYEDLMMMKLAMQCYNKQQYEEGKCYENDEKIYKRALEIINSANAKSKWLQQQRENLMKQRRLNRDKERQLKGGGSQTADAPPAKKAPPKNAPAKNVRAGGKDKQESVIVIDDD